MADETKEVSVICGPYQGNRLTMSTADADAAIAAHWARDQHSGVPYGEAHKPLSQEERETALTKANEWAQAQWKPPEPPPEVVTPPETRKPMPTVKHNV